MPVSGTACQVCSPGYQSPAARRRGPRLWLVSLILLALYVLPLVIALSTRNGRVWPWFRPQEDPTGPSHFFYLAGDSDTVWLAWLTAADDPDDDGLTWFEYSPFSTMWSLGHPDPDRDSARIRNGEIGRAAWSIVELKAGTESRWSDNPQVVIKSREIGLPVWLVVIPVLVLAVPPLLALSGFITETERTHKGQCPSCGYDLRASPEYCPECGRKLDNHVAGNDRDREPLARG